MSLLMRLRSILVLVPLVLAAACGEEASQDDARAASGQVLEGSISDAMLPVDTVRSQPPLADPVAAARATAAAVDSPAPDAAEEGGAPEPVEAAEEAEAPAEGEGGPAPDPAPAAAED